MMRLATWNVLNRARESDRILAFVGKVDADVIAFQELTSEHVEALQQLQGRQLFIAEDFSERGELTHLGLLTRLPASSHDVVTLNPELVLSDSLVGRLMQWVECIQSQALAIRTESGTVTVINVHLPCAVSPSARLAILADVASRSRSSTVILCGDFNSFATPWLNLALGWAFGFRRGDLLTREREAVTRLAKTFGMSPALGDEITLPRFRQQLDQVFVSGLDIGEVAVWPDSFGSDHRPVVADVLWPGSGPARL